MDLLLPPWLLRDSFGAPLWAWFALPLVGVAALGLARLADCIACRLVRVRNRPGSRLVRFSEAVQGPARLGVTVGLFRLGRSALPLPPAFATGLGYLELAVGTTAGVWLLLRATGVASDRLALWLGRRGKSQARAMIPLLRKVVKTALLLLGIIFLLQNAGIDVSAILAGLGIGGLALALAGQKTVENLFGGIALAVDQPARVGDFCKFGSSGGTIEDIGLRSTRIRTPEKTLVTVPNSQLSEMVIENFASRGRILLKTTISLSLQTSPVQLRAVVQGIRDILAARQEIQAPARVRLTGLSTSSLDVELFAYVDTTDFERFLEVKEDSYFAILELLERHRVCLASIVPLWDSPETPPDSSPATEPHRPLAEVR